jgi:hypothetical protein
LLGNFLFQLLRRPIWKRFAGKSSQNQWNACKSCLSTTKVVVLTTFGQLTLVGDRSTFLPANISLTGFLQPGEILRVTRPTFQRTAHRTALFSFAP